MKKLSKKQEQLLYWATFWHKNQVRKYTDEPYINHCKRVAEKADDYGIVLGWEIGICHDLIEDTECHVGLLVGLLQILKYSDDDVEQIITCVKELTDRYTKEDYTHLNRSERKALEAKRLWSISATAQSVKYCDLIDNTTSICEYDNKFAKVYLKEKCDILKGMRGGNTELLSTCELKLKDNLNKL